METYTGPERRSGDDRRQTNRSFRQQLLFPGKRAFVRREEDRKRIIYLDQYRNSALVGITFILVLSMVDAMLTLILLDHGAIELNPIMAFYIELGPKTFLLTKYTLTALSVILLLFFKDALSHRYGFGKAFFPFLAAVFGGVILWELYLLTRVSV
ncbi:MAG: DUF5658 family protein [Desulfobacterales bacterium]